MGNLRSADMINGNDSPPQPEKTGADPLTNLSRREQAYRRSAESPLGRRVIRTFLALRPKKQAQLLASMSPADSLVFRRMLGPEWTRKEDAATEAAGQAIWLALKAYIVPNP